MMAVHFFTEDITFILPTPEAWRTWSKRVIKAHGKRLHELNYIFCSDAYLHQLNLAHLQHDTFTDVLAFDYHDIEGTFMGDIYISLERVRENATKFGVHWTHELGRVMIHGVLHILGYRDQTLAEKKVMRAAEDRCLQEISILPVR